MSEMDVSLPDDLRSYVAAQVESGRFVTASDCIAHLIRRDRDRQALGSRLEAGARSEPGPIADDEYFTGLRDRVRREVPSIVDDPQPW